LLIFIKVFSPQKYAGKVFLSQAIITLKCVAGGEWPFANGKW